MTEQGNSTADKAAYRGKNFIMPTFSRRGGVRFHGNARLNTADIPSDSPIIDALNQPFDLGHFKTPRRPVGISILPADELLILATDSGAPRTLDMPIKFPGSDFRLPRELAMYAPIIRRIANYERAVNRACYDEYFAYLTIDKGFVEPGRLQREAPCHVDGFQGARWNPKVRANHTYTVANAISTAYYVQPFDFDLLDDAEHDFFWEMNRQVALTNGQFAWCPADGELTLMDCYSVHRGRQATQRTFRTFLRLSFEVRIFDRLGNAHNPLFQYEWPMVPRDIEALNLVAFDPNCDPSLRLFPWQDLDGKPLPKGVKTQPNLTPQSQ